jgi:hypothetical protein
MEKSGSWVTIAVAVTGFCATVVSGYLGYQGGSNAVNKDYVALAISTLDKKDASPELRRWSVDVLSKLSPVPFGRKLKEELESQGLSHQRHIFTRLDAPKDFLERCPDVLPEDVSSLPVDQILVIANSYEPCRIRHDALATLVIKYNELIDRTNAEEELRERKFLEEAGLEK